MKLRAVGPVFASLLVPPILLVEAWRARSLRYKHWMLTLFVTLYGATIAIAYDPSGEGPDGVRHLLGVYTYYVGLGVDQFLVDLWKILTYQVSDAPSSDVFKHVVSYFTGGVLGIPELFFPIVAFIYGYFFTGSLLLIFRNFGATKVTYVLVGFAAMFFLIKNIEGVNTVRTWTGMWILVYACLRYHETKHARYLALMFVPPLIHFAYLIMAIPAWMVLVLGDRPRTYAVLFVLSSFTTFLNPGTVVELVSVTEVGEHQARAYFREGVASGQAVLERAEQRGQQIWLTLMQYGVQKWALNVLVYTLLFTGVYFTVMDRFQKTIFSIGLLTVTLSNSTWYLYAVSNRSWIVGAVFLMAAFLMTRLDPKAAGRLPNRDPMYKIGLHASLVLFIPYFLFNLSTLFDFPSIFLLGFPFAAWVSPEFNMSMKEGLRFLLQAVL